MSHYISNLAISSVSTQRMHQRDQRNNSPGLHSDVHRCTFTGVHSDVAWESYLFDLFDMPFDIPLEC